jgi:hypothetical protein
MLLGQWLIYLVWLPTSSQWHDYIHTTTSNDFRDMNTAMLCRTEALVTAPSPCLRGIPPPVQNRDYRGKAS